MTRFVKDRSPALTTVAADRSWTLATGAGVVVAVVAVVAGLRRQPGHRLGDGRRRSLPRGIPGGDRGRRDGRQGCRDGGLHPR